MAVLVLVRIFSALFPEAAPVGAPGRWINRLSEVWLLAGLVGLTLHDLAFRRWAEAVGWVRISFLVILGAMLVLAQQRPAPDAHPFTTWDMYTRPVVGVTYVEYQLFHDGAEADAAHVPFSQLVPTTSPRAFMARLDSWVSDARGGDDEAHRQLTETFHQLNHRLDEPADAVVVRRCLVKKSTTTHELVRCEEAMRIEMTRPSGD